MALPISAREMTRKERTYYAREKKAKRDPIPEHFSSVEEAADFWDRHDTTDYLDQSRPVTDLVFRIQERQYLIALKPSLARKLSDAARRRGISGEALANLWLSEKLKAADQES